MAVEERPYAPCPCQRCGKPPAMVLKIGEHVVKGEVVYELDRRLYGENLEISGSSRRQKCRSGRQVTTGHGQRCLAPHHVAAIT